MSQVSPAPGLWSPRGPWGACRWQSHTGLREAAGVVWGPISPITLVRFPPPAPPTPGVAWPVQPRMRLCLEAGRRIWHPEAASGEDLLAALLLVRNMKAAAPGGACP